MHGDMQPGGSLWKELKSLPQTRKRIFFVTRTIPHFVGGGGWVDVLGGGGGEGGRGEEVDVLGGEGGGMKGGGNEGGIDFMRIFSIFFNSAFSIPLFRLSSHSSS